MDVSDTLIPKSDQLDAIDLLHSGPQTFTITAVTKNNDDQPLNIRLAEFPRVWRPGKSMRRVLAYCWGNESDVWVGKRVTLFCDERVKFGNEVTGGTRISHMSDLDGVKKVPLIVTKGRSATYTVQPLVENAAPKQAPTKQLDPETERALADLRARYEASTDEVERADLLAQRDRLLGGES